MSAHDFYQEVVHEPVPWRQYQLHVPLFFPEIRLMSAAILAPIARIKAILPSERMNPYRVTPWHSMLSITAYQYRQTDLGPYNEVAIAVPVTLDRQTPLFTGTLRKMPEAMMIYMHHLPVTTEIAREVGVEFAGYPKFVAEIEFTEEGDWLTCDLRADGQAILTLRGRKLALKPAPRLRLSPLTYRRGYILRSEFLLSESEMGASRSGQDVTLELGRHPIADELRNLNLGRVASYNYVPQTKGIVTPVFESFAG